MEDKQEIIRIAQDNAPETAFLLQNIEAIQQEFIKMYVLEPIQELVNNNGWKMDLKQNIYLPRNKRDGNPRWFVITPKDWKQHSVQYSFEDHGKKIIIGVFEKQSKIFRKGYPVVDDLLDYNLLTAIHSREIGKKLCDMVAKMVGQAELQAKKDGFQI